MTQEEINKKIQEKIKAKLPKDDIIRFVKGECQSYNLTPQTLGMIVEVYADMSYNPKDPLSGFSSTIPIEELKRIHPNFECSNGCSWARSDNSYLGKRYIINRSHEKNRVSAIKLDGLNDKSLKKYRGVKKEIYDKLSKEPCRVLGVHSQIEVDHKDGHYDSLSCSDTSTQKESDFQPLSKAANDAKRTHCKQCIKTGKRFNATTLGYSEGFLVGNEDTISCGGCYWYDVARFNQIISKSYKKTK